MVIRSLGWLISIIGKIRFGKTSLASGMSVAFQIEIIEKITEQMRETQTLFKNINFHDFHLSLIEILDHEYQINVHPNYPRIAKKLMDIYKLPEIPIYNFYNGQLTSEIIYDYIKGFEALNIRSNFVMSKTRFFSPLTMKMNIHFNVSSVEIKNLEKQKEYSIYDYMVLIHDEASDDRSAMKWHSQIESGAKEYRSKFGHIHKETNRFINIKQDGSDEVAKERSLIQSHVEIQSQLTQVFLNNKLYRFLEKLYGFKLKFYFFRKYKLPYFKYFLSNLFKERISFEEFFYGSKYLIPNKIRNLDHKLLFIKRWLSSLRYNVYHIKIYSNEEDIGKKSPEYYEEHQLVIPSIYCFTYPKFEFESIQDELLSMSTTRASEVNLFDKPKYFNTSFVSDTESGVDDVEF